MEVLDLTEITLVCQDWGGALGLTAAANHPERFARLVPMNTDLPSGEREMSAEWQRFHEFVETTDELIISRLVDNPTTTVLTEQASEAYDAPFQTEAEKAGAYAWPAWFPGVWWRRCRADFGRPLALILSTDFLDDFQSP